ncbi:MAG TPA: glucokinase [Puia sp.]|nr:glucokinase [Puia sp.]
MAVKNQSPVNLFFPRKDELTDKAITVLAGDVGGTKTNLAIFKATKNSVKVVLEKKYHSAKYKSCIDIIEQFIKEEKLSKPDRICLGVAGPVVQGKVEITNLNWDLDIKDLMQRLSVTEVSLINDLEATAYGLAALTTKDLITIHKGNEKNKGNIAIIAPGTGLGEAGLFWDGNAYHPFPTEGGHTDFCPRSETDFELHRFLQKKYGTVSWEKVIAGPGIHDIYLFLNSKTKIKQPAWITNAFKKDDPSSVISHAALHNKDKVCEETMQFFVRFLARESSNLVLKMKATGGLFLGGGIPPKIAPLLKRKSFFENYLNCDRMQNLVKDVPIKIMANDKTALLGAAYYGAYGMNSTN